jgi:hypothetical protein
MSDFNVLDGGLTDRCPPVLTDRRFAFDSRLFAADGSGGGLASLCVASGVTHGDVMIVDRDRSRRDGGGRPVDVVSTCE